MRADEGTKISNSDQNRQKRTLNMHNRNYNQKLTSDKMINHFIKCIMPIFLHNNQQQLITSFMSSTDKSLFCYFIFNYNNVISVIDQNYLWDVIIVPLRITLLSFSMEKISTLFIAKKYYTSNDLINILSNFEKTNEQSPIKLRIAIVAQISHIYLRVLLSFHAKLDIFNNSLFTNKNSKSRRQTTNRKKRGEQTIKKKGVYPTEENTILKQNKTLEKILQQQLASMRNSQTILSIPNQDITIRKLHKEPQEIISSKSQSNNRMMWQSMDHNIPIQMDLKSFQAKENFQFCKENHIINIGPTQIQLEKYRNLIQISQVEKQNKPKAISAQKTRKKVKNPPKKKQIDNKINVQQQESIKVDENLITVLTKTKQKKAFYHSIYQNLVKIELRNSILQDKQEILQFYKNSAKLLALQDEILQTQRIREQASELNQYFNYQELQNQMQSQSSQETDKSKFLYTLDKPNEKIKEKIENIINTKLQIAPLELTTFMNQKKMKKMSKALLFYELLSMDFDMIQCNSENFGQILVSKAY